MADDVRGGRQWAAAISPGYSIAGFVPALIGSAPLVVNWIPGALVDEK